MPGAGIVGTRYRTGQKSASAIANLPPQARNFARLLRLAKDEAVEAFESATEDLPFKIEGKVPRDHTKAALSFQAAIDKFLNNEDANKLPGSPARKNGFQLFLAEMSEKTPKGISSGDRHIWIRRASLQWKNLGPSQKDEYSKRAQLSTRIPQSLNIVSDPEDPGASMDITEDAIWTMALEKLHLELCTITTRSWGRKKKYEVYQMAGPAKPNTEGLCQVIVQEFIKVFLGSMEGSESCMLRYSDCRAYVTRKGKELWIQVNIGKPFDYTCHFNRNKAGSKKKKSCTEYVAVVTPESSLIALTASRAPSRSRFTPYVFAALENALTCTVNDSFDTESLQLNRIGNLSGHLPLELLKMAQSIQHGQATGRFAQYASAGKSLDPISDLHNAASGSLLSRASEEERMKLVVEHGPSLARRVSRWNRGETNLVACGKNYDVVEHGKKRKAGEVFGENLPTRTHLRWDWSGALFDDQDFTAQISLRGSDIFEGMKAMIDAGLLSTDLPAYVKDAPFLVEPISVVNNCCESKQI